ncbi:MAG: aldo/keto reductase [Pseudomonadota bacterium]
MKLALGTAQFGLAYGIANAEGQVTANTVGRILATARAANMDTIDTAIAYGESEQRLGEAGVGGWHVVSKLPAVPDDCTDIQGWVASHVDASLARLKVPRLGGLLLHRPGQLLKANGRQIYQALLQLRETGKVEKIGISIYEPSELDALCQYYVFDLIQAPLNVFDRRLVSSGWLQRLDAEGIEVHTRSAFLQGLLLMPRTALPVWFEQWPVVWNRWYQWLSEYHVSALQACLAYPLSLAGVYRVVVGADNPCQLAQIISAATLLKPADFPDMQLTDEKLINPARWVLS